MGPKSLFDEFTPPWSRSVYQSLTGSAKKTLGRITAIVDMWQRTVDESV